MTVSRSLLVGVSCLGLACAGGVRTGAVAPAEIPALATQARKQPNNAAVRFRLAAALIAAGRCDTAVVVARAGQILDPSNAVGPLVVAPQSKGSEQVTGSAVTPPDTLTPVSPAPPPEKFPGIQG